MNVLKVHEAAGQVVASEAAKTESKSARRWKVKIIQAGQGSSAYYPESVLENSVSVFRPGTHMYFDHPTWTEDFERPERSVRDLIGKQVSEAWYEDAAVWAEVEFYSWAAAIIEEAANDIGISIRALGQAEEGNNGLTLTSFIEVLSVDVVTHAGAGGQFVEMIESAREKTIEDYKTLIEENKETRMTPEQESKLDQLVASIAALTEAMKPEEKAKEEATAPSVDPLEIVAALSAADISESGRKMVLASVATGTELAEAIKTVESYEAEIRESAEKSREDVYEESEQGKPAGSPFKKFGA